MSQIITLRDPEMLNTFMVSDLLTRAFPDGTLLSGGFAENREHFAEMVADPHHVFLLGVEESALKAVALLLIPPDGDYIPAQVVHFYNEGSKRLRGQLVDAVVEILLARGHVKFWAINQSDHPDSVWVRTFRRAGDWSRIGSVMEVRMKDAATTPEA